MTTCLSLDDMTTIVLCCEDNDSVECVNNAINTLFSMNEDQSAIQVCLQTIIRMLSNIEANKHDIKFR